MLDKLAVMLNNEESNIVVNEFNDLGETTLHLANLNNIFATVTQVNDKICIDIEAYVISLEDYYLVETKEYKTVRGAYNYIKKMLP